MWREKNEHWLLLQIETNFIFHTTSKKLYCTLTNIQCISCADDNNKHYLSQQQKGNKNFTTIFCHLVLVCPSMSPRCHNKKYYKIKSSNFFTKIFITCLHSNNRYNTVSVGVVYTIMNFRRKCKTVLWYVTILERTKYNFGSLLFCELQH